MRDLASIGLSASLSLVLAACASGAPTPTAPAADDAEPIACTSAEPQTYRPADADAHPTIFDLTQPVPPCMDESGADRDPATCGVHPYSVLRDDDEGQQDLFVYRYADGSFHHYPSIAERGSGGGCPWQIEESIVEIDGWLVMSLSSELYEWESRSCDEVGRWTKLLFIEAASGRVAADVVCIGDGEPEVTKKGGAIHVSGCRGAIAPITPTALAACARR